MRVLIKPVDLANYLRYIPVSIPAEPLPSMLNSGGFFFLRFFFLKGAAI